MCSGIVLVLVGVIDLALAIALIFGVVHQVSFMPTSYGGCRNASDWRNGTDGRNYFIVANMVDDEGSSAKKKCDEYVRSYIFTIAVMQVVSLA